MFYDRQDSHGAFNQTVLCHELLENLLYTCTLLKTSWKCQWNEISPSSKTFDLIEMSFCLSLHIAAPSSECYVQLHNMNTTYIFCI